MDHLKGFYLLSMNVIIKNTIRWKFSEESLRLETLSIPIKKIATSEQKSQKVYDAIKIKLGSDFLKKVLYGSFSRDTNGKCKNL